MQEEERQKGERVCGTCKVWELFTAALGFVLVALGGENIHFVVERTLLCLFCKGK